MKLPELMHRFLALGQGYAGRGPDHPEAPNPDLRPLVESFFAQHRALLRDPTYVEFLRTYAGATVTVSDPEGDEVWFAFLMGLCSDGGEIVPFTEEGYGADEEGFLCVAKLYHQRRRVELDFAYAVTGVLQPGLHRIVNRDGRESRGWYCHSFAEWLAHFVQAGEAIFSE
jgi:hypothetical protein